MGGMWSPIVRVEHIKLLELRDGLRHCYPNLPPPVDYLFQMAEVVRTIDLATIPVGLAPWMRLTLY